MDNPYTLSPEDPAPVYVEDTKKLRVLLWTAAILTFVVGDVMTTIYGLHIGLSETNPVVYSVAGEYGYFGILVVKIFGISTVIAIDEFIYQKIVSSKAKKVVISMMAFFFGAGLSIHNLLLAI